MTDRWDVALPSRGEISDDDVRDVEDEDPVGT
jgi:hypothetical protein